MKPLSLQAKLLSSARKRLNDLERRNAGTPSGSQGQRTDRISTASTQKDGISRSGSRLDFLTPSVKSQSDDGDDPKGYPYPGFEEANCPPFQTGGVMVRDTSDEMYFQDNQLKSHGRYAVLDDDGIAREESGYYGNGRDVRNYTGGGTKSLNQALGRTGHEMEDRDDRAVRMRHSGGLDTHAEYSGHASIAYHSRGPQAYRPQELPSGTSAHGEIIYRDQPSQSHVVSAKGSPSPDTSPTSDYHASFTNYPTNTVNDEVVYTQAADTRGDNPVYFAGQKKKIGYKDGTAESRLEFLRDAAQRPDPLARPTELFTHQSPDVAKTAPVIASSQALPRMPTNSGGGHYFPGIRAESILGTQSSADNSERPPYDTNPGPYSHRQMGPDRYHFGEIELQPTPAEDHVRGKAQGNHLNTEGFPVTSGIADNYRARKSQNVTEKLHPMARISPEDDPERPGSEFQQTDGTTKYPARDPAQLRTASPDAGEPLPSVHAYRATKGKPASTRGHVRSPGCSSDEALSADDNVVHISQPHQAAYVSSRSSSSARMQHPGSTMPFFSSRGTQNGVSYPPNARAGSIKSSPYHQLKTEIDAFERDLTRSLNALFRCEDNFHPQSVSTPEDSPEYLCTRLHSLRNYMNERLYSWFELCSSGGSMEKNYDNKIYQGAHTQVKDIFKSEGRKLHIGISDLCAPNTYNASGGYCTGIDRARDIDDDGRGYSLKFAELFHDALKLMRSVKDTLPDYSKTSGFSSKFEDVEGRLVDALKLCSDPKSAASAVSENSNMGMIRSTVGATPHDYHSAQRDRLVVSSREPPGGEPASFSHYQKVVQHEPDHSTGLLLHPGTSGIYVNSHALTHIKNTIYRICDKLSRNSDQKLREELVSILSLFEGAISCPIADVNSTGNLHSTDLEEILTSQNLLATLGVPANPQIASSLHDITDRVTALSAEHMPSVLSDRSLGAVNAEELDRNLSEALASSPNSEYVSLGRDKMELFHRAWRHEVVKGSIFRSMLIQMNYAFCINLNDIFNDFDKVMDAFDRATHSLEVERSKNKKMAAEYMRQIQTNYDNLANQNLALKNKVDADNKVKDMENLEITRRLERLEVMAGNSKLAERGPDPSDRSAEGPNPRTRNLSV